MGLFVYFVLLTYTMIIVHGLLVAFSFVPV